MLEFKETATERQLWVRQEWDTLYKTENLTALQFEAKWVRLIADLTECGRCKTGLELLLAYVEKMGPNLGEEVRKDRRPRPDGAGGTTTRAPRAWEEAHEVVVELEGIRAGTKSSPDLRKRRRAGSAERRRRAR